MIGGVFAAGLSVIAGLIWWYQIVRLHNNLVDPIVTFGERKEGGLSPEERNWVLSEHVRQERWAFGLVWFAVATGMIMGSILVARFVLARQIDKSELAGIIGLAGDLTVATGAFRLYKRASNELREIMKSMH